jgi:molybdenum-dependent DNA-binding transcriptional regulator ModE
MKLDSTDGTDRCSTTPQEQKVLRAIARHGTIKAAAKALTMSRHTAEGHLDSMRNKCKLRFLPQLVAWAAVEGWLGDVFRDP